MPHLPVKMQSMQESIYKKAADRFGLQNNYKESDGTFLRGDEIEKKLHEHFMRNGHQKIEEDVSICLIEKTDFFDPHLKDITAWGIVKK